MATGRLRRRYILLGVGALGAGAYAAWRYFRKPDPTFDSDGVPIRYRVVGTGQPLLLLHGYGLGMKNWYGLPENLGKLFTTIAFDARGHAGSGHPNDAGAYGVKMVDDIPRLLDHLKLDSAHVLGYSMGGMIASKLLERHPDRVRSAVLGAAGPLRAESETVKYADRDADLIERGIQFVGGDKLALAHIRRSFKDWIPSERALRTNRVPTIAIFGDGDPMRDDVSPWDHKMGCLEIVELSGCGHSDALWKPEFFEKAEQFWRKIGAIG